LIFLVYVLGFTLYTIWHPHVAPLQKINVFVGYTDVYLWRHYTERNYIKEFLTRPLLFQIIIKILRRARN